MKARDVMVSPVVTVKPETAVEEIAKLLLKRRISAVPVVDDEGKLRGMVSEGDLLRRVEAETEHRRSWWLRAVTGDDTLAQEYIKAHGRRAADVMTEDVVTATPDTPLADIALLLEKNAIKRVPIMSEGRLVGIVSRANLIQALATAPAKSKVKVSDAAIREKLMAHLREQNWADTSLLNVTVSDGVVSLWGIVSTDTQRDALRLAAEQTPGVKAVNDHLGRRRAWGM
jgi:CBS domain-containing protein